MGDKRQSTDDRERTPKDDRREYSEKPARERIDIDTITDNFKPPKPPPDKK